MKKIKEGMRYIRYMQKVYDVELDRQCVAHNEFVKFDVMVNDDGEEIKNNFRVDVQTKLLTYNESHYNIHNYNAKKELTLKDRVELILLSTFMFIVILLILYTNGILQHILLK